MIFLIKNKTGMSWKLDKWINYAFLEVQGLLVSNYQIKESV